MKSYLFEFFTFILITKATLSIEFDVKLGSKIEICCTLNHSKVDGLSIIADNLRLKMLINSKLIPQDMNLYTKNNPNYRVEMKADKLCLLKDVSTVKDDKKSFKCVIVDQGYGSSLKEETHTIRIFEELKFIKIPQEKLLARVGDDLVEECSATGSPDLQVIWRTESKGKVASGSSAATLKINGVTVGMNGMKYTCEASISIPKGPMGTINKTVTLDVRFKPEIDVETLIVHTDLGFEETFTIKVKGNPQPKISCPLLNIPAEKIMTITDTDQFSYIYEMKINKIAEQHIGTKLCTVENEEGTATKQVSLVLKPDNLKITSTNDTQFSNCYMFSWSMNSKSPITNFTVTAKANNETVYRQMITESDISSIRKNVAKKENNWLNEFSYTFFNLTSNQQYTLSLKTCNKHECILFEDGAFFKTKQSNGNQCDPAKLTSNFNSNDPRKNSRDIKPTLIFVCTQSIITFLVPLILQQVF